MAAAFARKRCFELMVMRFRHQPHFERHARSVRAKSIVVARIIYNAFGLPNFLSQNVAKDAPLVGAIPFSRAPQFVQNSPRYERRRRNLRVRVRPFLSRLRPLVLEYSDVLESRIPFQIRDAQRVRFQHSLDFFVIHPRERTRVLCTLHNYFVRARCRHPVVNPLGAAPGLTLNSIQRTEVRKDTNLRWSVRRQTQNRGHVRSVPRTQWTWIRPHLFPLRMPDHYPAPSDRIFAKFHFSV